MDVITKPISNLDEIAKAVFYNSIELLGGIKNLIDYRNLTWLPTLAEASYVVVLKNEGALTNREIAERLGLSEQTVENILRAKEAEPSELKEMDTHKAGAIAKMAYKSTKAKHTVELDRETADILNILWAFNVLRSIKGTDFPIDKETAMKKLSGLMVRDRPIEELLEKLDYPVRTPSELIKKLKEAL